MVALNKVRCYSCGKVVENENDLVMNNVQINWYSSMRMPFHLECWRVFRARNRKRDLIAIAALFNFFVLFAGIFLSIPTQVGELPLLGFFVLGLSIAVFIGLVVGYYRTRED